MIIYGTRQIFEEQLTSDQQAAASKLAHTGGGLVLWSPGTGKTRIALMAFAMMQNLNEWVSPSVLLVVCRRKAFDDWEDECQKILPNCRVFRDFVPDATQCHDSPAVSLISEGMLCKLQTSLAIRVVVYDESWLYANYQSKRSKIAAQIAKHRIGIALSGTVMKAKNLLEVYSQLKVTNKASLTGADSASAFRSMYQICDNGSGFPIWKAKPGAYKLLMERIAPVTSVNFPASPRASVTTFHRIDATPAQREAFKELKDWYSLDQHDIELDSVMGMMHKIQQISNGWISTPNGIKKIASNKPAKLIEELESITANPDTKVVVWCAYRHDVAMLQKLLTAFNPVTFIGGQEFELEAWRTDPRVRVCIATEASGSSVNHFAQVQHAIYFSCNFKWIDMQQSRKRTDRHNSKHTHCHYKYLQVAGSLDAHITAAALTSGVEESRLIEEAQQAIIKWAKK